MTADAGLTPPVIAERFAAARVWWLATASPEHGPHAVPVWGVVVDGDLVTYVDPQARRHANLTADPRCVLHLESGTDVLLVHGVAEDIGTPAEHPDVCAAYHRAYPDPDDAQFLPDAPEMEGIRFLRVVPRSAMAWDVTRFFASQRRWRADVP